MLLNNLCLRFLSALVLRSMLVSHYSQPSPCIITSFVLSAASVPPHFDLLLLCSPLCEYYCYENALMITFLILFIEVKIMRTKKTVIKTLLHYFVELNLSPWSSPWLVFGLVIKGSRVWVPMGALSFQNTFPFMKLFHSHSRFKLFV